MPNDTNMINKTKPDTHTHTNTNICCLTPAVGNPDAGKTNLQYKSYFNSGKLAGKGISQLSIRMEMVYILF
jgi:hypothetical protein